MNWFSVPTRSGICGRIGGRGAKCNYQAGMALYQWVACTQKNVWQPPGTRAEVRLLPSVDLRRDSNHLQAKESKDR